MMKRVECGRCNGLGTRREDYINDVGSSAPNSEYLECNECNGTGYIDVQYGISLFDKESPADEAIQNAFLKSINMNNPPGNPTEIETKLAELEAEVIAINESIKNQDHVIWLAKVEKSKQKAILNATLAAIEAITKPKES